MIRRNKIFILFFLAVFCAVGLNGKLAAQNRKSVSGAEATGTFRAKGGNEFKIAALGRISARGRNGLKIEFSGLYEYKYDGLPIANIGEASGTAMIAGDTAVFKPEGTENCTIIIKFLPNRTIRVTQNGSDGVCGFGHNVYADGTYKKISGQKPNFEN